MSNASRCTNQTKHAVAILVKLLIDVQDQIWFEIGNCKFMTATTLLQLSVHIKTGRILNFIHHLSLNSSKLRMFHWFF